MDASDWTVHSHTHTKKNSVKLGNDDVLFSPSSPPAADAQSFCFFLIYISFLDFFIVGFLFWCSSMKRNVPGRWRKWPPMMRPFWPPTLDSDWSSSLLFSLSFVYFYFPIFSFFDSFFIWPFFFSTLRSEHATRTPIPVVFVTDPTTRCVRLLLFFGLFFLGSSVSTGFGMAAINVASARFEIHFSYEPTNNHRRHGKKLCRSFFFNYRLFVSRSTTTKLSVSWIILKAKFLRLKNTIFNSHGTRNCRY